MHKHLFAIIVCLLFTVASYAQDVSKRISEKTRLREGIEYLYRALHFMYEGENIAYGYEFRFYNKGAKKRCIYDVFFVEGNFNTKKIKDKNLFDWLKKNAINYNYIGHQFLMGCILTNVDTFYYCRNENLYNERNFPEFYPQEANYYGSQQYMFTVAKVKVCVDRFVSYDTSFKHHYYHFADSNANINAIRYVHYRNVISREFIKADRLFNYPVVPRKTINFECMIISD